MCSTCWMGSARMCRVFYESFNSLNSEMFCLCPYSLPNKCHSFLSLSLFFPPFVIALWMMVHLIYLVLQPQCAATHSSLGEQIRFSTHRPNQLVENWTTEARARVGVPYTHIYDWSMYSSICKSDLWSMRFTLLYCPSQLENKQHQKR